MNPRTFQGARVRTEADAQNAGWNSAPNWNSSAQSGAYISHAREKGLKIVYITSSNAGELARFLEKASALTIIFKPDLLAPNPPARQELEALTWNQQAWVDYEGLGRYEVFGGVVKSSSSLNVAVSRKEMAGGLLCEVGRRGIGMRGLLLMMG
jgi:hypothetical protein